MTDAKQAGPRRKGKQPRRNPGIAQKPGSAVIPARVEIHLDEPETDKLRAIGGSKSDRFNNGLIRAVVETGWFPAGQSDQERDQQLFVAVTGLRAFKPQDEIEAMIAGQAMAMHHASMECSRRAMNKEQPFEIAQGFRKAAANASRTFTELLSALDRKRGKAGHQVVRVEHIHISPGGRAVVGNIGIDGPRGGGGQSEISGKPRTPPPALAHDATLGAVLPAMRGANAERELVPVASDAERPVSDPRRREHGAENGGGG